MSARSVLVIGAGVGGIAAAARLARDGLHVTVIEKNDQPGGRCDRFERDGHIFDAGPTLLVMPLLYEAEFRVLGASLHDMLDLQRVDPTYHLVFDDSRQLALTSDLSAMRAQLETFEPGSFAGFLRYLQEGGRHYQLGIERLVRRDFRTAADFFSPSNLPLLWQLKPLVNHYRNMSAYFKNPRLKTAFTFQDVYMGLSPFQSPATFSMMPYTELAHGVWYPRGGMYQIVEALMQLARQAGVEFEFDVAVERIEVEHGKARRLVLEDGRRLEADIVLANADLPYVYQQLLPQDKLAGSLARKRYSCSVISFFWGLDPAMSPPGQDTLIAIVPVGHLGENGDQDWPALRERAREQVFRRLTQIGVHDLASHIQFEVNYTPFSWRKRYNLVKGATHGLSHPLTQLAYFRPSNRHPRYANLYFVGASTHPGTGLPTALVSARLTAQRILDEI